MCLYICVRVYVCAHVSVWYVRVCVFDRERERARERECVCVRERESVFECVCLCMRTYTRMVVSAPTSAPTLAFMCVCVRVCVCVCMFTFTRVCRVNVCVLVCELLCVCTSTHRALAKLLDYFVRCNESNINQSVFVNVCMLTRIQTRTGHLSVWRGNIKSSASITQLLFRLQV